MMRTFGVVRSPVRCFMAEPLEVIIMAAYQLSRRALRRGVAQLRNVRSFSGITFRGE